MKLPRFAGIAGVLAWAALVACSGGGSVGDRIVRSARQQIEWKTVYDPSYVKLAFPGGDVPKDRGVCTDVVVRALRAVGKDLQVLVHQDRKARPGSYRPYRGQKGADPNIDHRRCPNLAVFFKKHGRTLTLKMGAKDLSQWKPGDVVFWKLDNGRDHVGIVTDRRDDRGVPFVIHNLSTTLEEPVLNAWKIVGHFRYPE